MKPSTALLAAAIALARTAAPGSPAAGNDATLDAIAHINHVNWVVNTVKAYANAVALEEEYRKISVGNLNLARIPDEEILGNIKGMLDTLHQLRGNARMVETTKRRLARERRIAKIDFGRAKSGEVLDGIANAAKGAAIGDLYAVAEFARSVAGIYSDYEKLSMRLDNGEEDALARLDEGKLALLHEKNKELLDFQWRLVKSLGAEGERMLVSDGEMDALRSCLSDDDAGRLYARLAAMKSRFPSSFPEYWANFALSCLATGRREECIAACDRFFAVNRGLFRTDPYEWRVALAKALSLPATDAGKPEIARLLSIATAGNSIAADHSADALIGGLWKSAFGDDAKAAAAYSHAIACAEAEIAADAAAGFDADDALRSALRSYRRAYLAVAYDEKEWRRCFDDPSASCNDRLWYCANAKAKHDPMAEMPDDFRGVSLSLDGRTATARFPVRWIATDGVMITLAFRDGGETVARVPGSSAPQVADGVRTASISFDAPDGAAERADSFLLEFGNPDCPASFLFSSSALARRGFKEYAAKYRVPKDADWGASPDNAAGFRRWNPSLADDLFCFEISVLGRTYRWIPSSGFDSPRHSADEPRLDACAIVPGAVAAGTSSETGFGSVSFRKDGRAEIRVANRTLGLVRPVATVLALNGFGAVTGAYADERHLEYTASRKDDFTDVLTFKRAVLPYATVTFETPPLKAAFVLADCETATDAVRRFARPPVAVSAERVSDAWRIGAAVYAVSVENKADGKGTAGTIRLHQGPWSTEAVRFEIPSGGKAVFGEAEFGGWKPNAGNLGEIKTDGADAALCFEILDGGALRTWHSAPRQ